MDDDVAYEAQLMITFFLRCEGMKAPSALVLLAPLSYLLSIHNRTFDDCPHRLWNTYGFLCPLKCRDAR